MRGLLRRWRVRPKGGCETGIMIRDGASLSRGCESDVGVPGVPQDLYWSVLSGPPICVVWPGVVVWCECADQ